MRNRRTVERQLNAFRIKDGQALLERVALELFEALDTPISLSCYLLLKHGELKQLVSKKFDPSWYLEGHWRRARDDYQAISFLRKTPLEIEGVNRRETAAAKFAEAEGRCLLTNNRFRALRASGYKNLPSRLHSVLHTAQWKISETLGKFSAGEWADKCRFGPGSDNLNKGQRVSAFHKLTSDISATTEFSEGARALVLDHPSWVRSLDGLLPDDFGPASQRVSVVSAPGNSVTFVPKDAVKDRVIAIEPHLNIYAQLGIGAMMRLRLRRKRLDLNTQGPSRGLAKRGSLLGDVATVDLSMASDTIALEVVRELIPEEWFIPMDWCRSRIGDLDGKCISYEKFSSMGNGFTFELESLIFWALALACCEVSGVSHERSQETVRSYGDDIAVPVEVVPLLEEVLEFFGFLVNPDKTYYSGLFRESCGSDYFNGYNVRPTFIKEVPSDVSSLFKLANSVRRIAYYRNRKFGCDRELRPVWLTVVRRLPKSAAVLLGPPEFGGLNARETGMQIADGYLIENFDRASASPYFRPAGRGMEGVFVASLVARPHREDVQCVYARTWLFALYAGRDGTEEPLGGLVSLRASSNRRLHVGRLVPRFHDLGPWW